MKKTETTDLFPAIRAWGESKGITGKHGKATDKTQFLKLIEELGELSTGLARDDQPEIEDAIGDCVVVLTLLADLRGVTIEDCIRGAYDVISKRTGRMVDGVFVKDGGES